jgi:hypothetical protein
VWVEQGVGGLGCDADLFTIESMGMGKGTPRLQKPRKEDCER